MSNVAVETLTPVQKTALVYSYAALLLHDSKKDVTEKNLDALVKVSGNKDDKIWSKVMAKSLKGRYNI
jgi:ribosomal protein L12E/L44/L45/RPP1/RPP2